MQKFKTYFNESVESHNFTVSEDSDIKMMIKLASIAEGFEGYSIDEDYLEFDFETEELAEAALNEIFTVMLEITNIGDRTGDACYIVESVIEEEYVNERKIIVKVNSKGQRNRRQKCKPQEKLNSKGTCVPQTGAEKNKKKIATRKGVRTKKAKGAGAQKLVNKKTSKAKRKRKSFGL